jgi:hypothetical protein
MLKLVPDKQEALSITDQMFSKLEKYNGRKKTSKDVVVMGLIIFTLTVRPFLLITCFLAVFFSWSVYKEGFDIVSVVTGSMLLYWLFSFVKISMETLASVLKEESTDEEVADKA